MWIPILSSVSLTSESSASVRSSKGKLQLEEIRPIERTQRERRRIVIVTIISRCARFTDGFTDDKVLFIINAAGGRPTWLWLLSWRCIYLGNQTLARIKGDRSIGLRPINTIQSTQFSGGVCVRLLVCKMSSLAYLRDVCISLLVLYGKSAYDPVSTKSV